MQISHNLQFPFIRVVTGNSVLVESSPNIGLDAQDRTCPQDRSYLRQLNVMLLHSLAGVFLQRDIKIGKIPEKLPIIVLIGSN